MTAPNITFLGPSRTEPACHSCAINYPILIIMWETVDHSPVQRPLVWPLTSLLLTPPPGGRGNTSASFPGRSFRVMYLLVSCPVRLTPGRCCVLELSPGALGCTTVLPVHMSCVPLWERSQSFASKLDRVPLDLTPFCRCFQRMESLPIAEWRKVASWETWAREHKGSGVGFLFSLFSFSF